MNSYLLCPDFRTMFNKKKKERLQISAPHNFEHRVHTGYDAEEDKFVGLPMQWAGVINPPSSSARPKPIVDASFVTHTDMHNTKVSIVMIGQDSWPG